MNEPIKVSGETIAVECKFTLRTNSGINNALGGTMLEYEGYATPEMMHALSLVIDSFREPARVERGDNDRDR